LVGGLERVYELNRSFRNEGVSTRHNPEFTMFEVYVAYADYEEMMRLSEELLTALTQQVLGRQELTYQGKTISLSRPWQRYSFSSLVKEKFGIEPADDTALITKKLKDKGLLKEAVGLSRSQVNKLIEDILAQEIGSNPVFVTDYFSGLCPLAKARQDNPLISERFELYIGGLEIGNAYSELNDPQEQRRRFAEELKLLNKEEQKALDEDYCLALEHGMPPAAGLGIGVDRIVMLLADQPSIRDVILFPLLREE
jgi:lysyl-tRNA synthetase class 2